MEQVQTAHQNASRLSKLLEPAIGMICAVAGLVLLHWTVWMILPRPVGQDFVSSADWKQPVAACGLYGLSTWLLLASGARVTTACDGLLEQVSRLHRWEPSINRRQRVMEKPANLVRVEGIRGFCQELNAGQGLGYTFASRLVTADAVTQLILQGWLLMAIGFPLAAWLLRDSRTLRPHSTTTVNATASSLPQDAAEEEIARHWRYLRHVFIVAYLVVLCVCGGLLLRLFERSVRRRRQSLEELEQAQYSLIL